MTQEIQFTKASGAGNDFVIVDNMSRTLCVDKSSLAQKLCSRNFGIGADGLLILEPSQVADFTMEYYNADGSHGGMCGNGGRCVARYAFLHNLAPQNMKFEALDFVYTAEVVAENVILTMKNSTNLKKDIAVLVGSDQMRGFFVNTGSPHLVIFVDDVSSVPVQEAGRKLREDQRFAPDGTNVNFVQVTASDAIRVRTYERGVEAETLACGTGSVASAITANLFKGIELPVNVQVRSGEILKVHASKEGMSITSPKLEGSAHMLFKGNILFDSNSSQVVDII